MATKKTTTELRDEGRARCARCLGIYTLIHKTKTHPEGARLHAHKDWHGRNCYGAPVRI